MYTLIITVLLISNGASSSTTSMLFESYSSCEEARVKHVAEFRRVIDKDLTNKNASAVIIASCSKK